MKTIIRKDEGAVSPVIATILMVAITVVLAAVLYVMVSGLLTPTGTGPRVMGVNVGRSADGTNWTLTVTSTPTGLTAGSVRLTIIGAGGTTALTPTFLYQLSGNTRYIPVAGGSPTSTTTVSVGDRILISTATYPSGYQYQLADGTSILASGTLQG